MSRIIRHFSTTQLTQASDKKAEEHAASKGETVAGRRVDSGTAPRDCGSSVLMMTFKHEEYEYC